MEIWKDIVGYEGHYQVSGFGNVKSLKYSKEKLLKPRYDGKGYFHVNLCKCGKHKNRKIHQLVAEAFLGHTPDGYNGLIIDHKNNIKSDNRVENLQITTARHNTSKDRKGSSKYTGVSWYKRSSKWTAQIQINGKLKYLGAFTNEIEASNAYQQSIKKLN